MVKKLLLLGGGGHCKSVLDSLLPAKEYAAIGIVEKGRGNGDSVFGVPVVGIDEDLRQLFTQGYHYAFFAVGSTANPGLRMKFYNELKRYGFQIPNIFDPSAVVSSRAELGEGVFVGKNAVVNAEAKIGTGTIINTSAVVEYEAEIGDFVHIGPGALITGGVVIGNYAHIGTGSIVKKKINIGAYAMIGAGSVVNNDIREAMIASGNPCRPAVEDRSYSELSKRPGR